MFSQKVLEKLILKANSKVLAHFALVIIKKTFKLRHLTFATIANPIGYVIMLTYVCYVFNRLIKDFGCASEACINAAVIDCPIVNR